MATITPVLVSPVIATRTLFAGGVPHHLRSHGKPVTQDPRAPAVRVTSPHSLSWPQLQADVSRTEYRALQEVASKRAQTAAQLETHPRGPEHSSAAQAADDLDYDTATAKPQPARDSVKRLPFTMPGELARHS
jgi:hypothetical protein